MTSCRDLCTADKCRELEDRIEYLESKLLALESELSAHTNLTTSNAHPFDLNITGLLQYELETNSINLALYLVDVTSSLLATAVIEKFPLPFITEWDFNTHKNQSIPDAHNYNPNVLVDIR